LVDVIVMSHRLDAQLKPNQQLKFGPERAELAPWSKCRLSHLFSETPPHPATTPIETYALSGLDDRREQELEKPNASRTMFFGNSGTRQEEGEIPDDDDEPPFVGSVIGNASGLSDYSKET
jgi:hypothetical protein